MGGYWLPTRAPDRTFASGAAHSLMWIWAAGVR